MGRSQETFGKKEREKKKAQKRKEKAAKREERKDNNDKGKDWEDMISYVDENGQLTDTPPDPTKKRKEIKLEQIEIGVPKREEEEMPSELTGRVEFFNHDKGYGFIKDSGSRESYFVHINGCLEEIVEGNRVSFELEKGLKGLNAVKVKKVK